jgi:Xaa-Pro aminopeptidase
MGHAFLSVHDTALRVLTQGLMDLNLIQDKCSLESAIEQKLYQPFFMHKIGHWLGLDVHDVGNYQEIETGNSRILQSNMVMTVEPGLYIPPLEYIPQEFHHIGIRIEDDILITTINPIVLGVDILPN